MHDIQNQQVNASWYRSGRSGLQPGDLPRASLSATSAERLARVAAPVMETIREGVAGTSMSLLLADADGVIVDRAVGNRNVDLFMDTIGAVVDADYSEENAGTNAIGTPLEIRGEFTINGEEHYLEALKMLSCYGAPIFHPLTGRVVGALDIADNAERASSLFRPYISRMIADIRTRLLENSRLAERALFDSFQQLAKRDRAVVALGSSLVLQNNLADDLLMPADHAVLHELRREVPKGRAIELELTLSSGQSCTITGTRPEGAADGVVFEVHRGETKRTVPRGPGPRGTYLDRLEAPALSAARGGHDLAIVGEPGSGRSTLARSVAEKSGRTVTTPTVATLTRSELLEATQDAGSIVVLDDIEQIPTHLIGTLNEVLASTGSRSQLVMVTIDLGAVEPSVRAVVSNCTGRIEVAPLRDHPDEIPTIAARILTRSDHRAWLSRDAAAALMQAPWPGNLTELTSALSTAAAAASTKRVEVHDLPLQFRDAASAPRHAVRADTLEKRLLVEALETARWNKAQAAKALGISRNTLYARMRRHRVIEPR